MFERGARAFAANFRPALEAAGLQDHAVYVCPLCLKAWDERALVVTPPILSGEHVPPRALGGTPMCLTCRACNNGAARINAAAAYRQRESAVFRGESDGSVPIRLAADGNEVGADFNLDGRTFRIMLAPGRSNPQHYYAPNSIESAARNSKPLTMKVTVRSYRRWHERVSGFRDAYLVAFSTFGYRYVYRQQLNPVREQISNPDEVVIRHFRLRIPSDSSTNVGRTILLMEDPFPALLIGFGKEVYCLPHPNGPGEEAWARIANGDGRIDFTGERIKWPERMDLSWDFAA